MSRAVYVSIVPLLGLVLYMRGRDCDTSCAFLGSLVNHIVVDKLVYPVRLGHRLCDCGCERRLAMIDVTCR